MSIVQIDEAILTVVGDRWKKVARVIAEVAKGTSDDLPSGERLQLISEHIEGLVNDGRLVAQGDIKKWGFSEVRRA